MNTSCKKLAMNPYSAENVVKPVHFFCRAPKARSVCLIGDFNDWDPTAHPMRRQADGSWFVEAQLAHGHHEYLFLVDGKPRPDAQAMGAVRNERYDLVSLIAVS